jgi:hypothetical protein
VSLVVLGLGVFAVAAGLLLRFYAYPALAKIPHDPKTKSVAQGSGITALVYVPKGDASVPEIHKNLSLTSTTFVSGDLRAAEVQENSEVTAWVEATRVRDDSSNLVVSASVRQLCLDRFTGEAAAPCEVQYIEKEQDENKKGKKVTGSRNQVQFPGLNFKFPFTTEQKTYKWFDTSLGKPVDAKFEGTDTIQGLEVYRFLQSVPSTRIENRDVPGSLIGRTEPTVKAGLYYEVERTLWIEPVTGAVIKGKQAGRQVLRADDQSSIEGTDVFNGTLEFNDETVNANVDTAGRNKSKLWLLTGLPTILWIVGGVLILLGILLVVRNRRVSAYA